MRAEINLHTDPEVKGNIVSQTNSVGQVLFGIRLEISKWGEQTYFGGKTEERPAGVQCRPKCVSIFVLPYTRVVR